MPEREKDDNKNGPQNDVGGLSDRSPEPSGEVKEVPEVDPNAPVTQQQLDAVIKGMGTLMENTLKTAVTEFQGIIDQKTKQTDAVLEQHSNIINKQNTLLKAFAQKISGGSSGAASQGEAAASSSPIGGGGNLMDQARELLALLQEGKGVLGQDQGVSRVDQLIALHRKGMEREVEKVELQAIRRYLKKGILEPDEVAGIIEDKVSEHTGLAGSG